MKKHMILTVGAFASSALMLTGCGSDSDKESPGTDYPVSGTVYQKWIEYECGAHTLSMENVAFSKPTPRSTSGGGGSSASPKDKKDGGTDRKKSPSASPSSSAVKVSPGAVPTGKPRKPPGYSAKNCTTEYELYIKNGDGIFEQDVPYSHYQKCAEGAKFSRCAE